MTLKWGIAVRVRRFYVSVVGISRFVAARDRLLAAVGSELSLDGLLGELVSALHEVAAFEACAVVTTDPETTLPTGGMVENFSADTPDLCAQVWDNELLDPDFNKLNALARSTDPVATLYEATDGDLTRSPRYVKLYEPRGIGDELRVAFAYGGVCWAVGVLMRSAARRPFDVEEIESVRNLVPPAARALQQVTIRGYTAGRSAGPVMLVVDADGVIESMTPDGLAQVDDLRIDGESDSKTPTAVLAAVRRANSDASGTGVAVRARGASGRWMKIKAARLERGGGRVAVIIEGAHPTDLVRILLDSYGLTERETHVVFMVARGLSTKEIANSLYLSPHTVRDHLKSIFDKTGVSSRGELVARLFFDHLFPAYEDAITPFAS